MTYRKYNGFLLCSSCTAVTMKAAQGFETPQSRITIKRLVSKFTVRDICRNTTDKY